MDLGYGLSAGLAATGAIYILVTVVCIALAWWGVQQIRLDLFLKHPSSPPAKMLQIMLSVALGYQLSRFVIDYLNWSALLKGMFS